MNETVDFGGVMLRKDILAYIQWRLERYSFEHHYVALEKETDHYGDLANGIKTNVDETFPTQGNSIGKALGPYLDALSLRYIVSGMPPISIFCSLKNGELAGYPSDGFYEMCRNSGAYFIPAKMTTEEKKTFVDHLRRVFRSRRKLY